MRRQLIQWLFKRKSIDTICSYAGVKELTARLDVRSYSDDDYSHCLDLYSDPEITHFFDHGKPRTKIEIDAFLTERGLCYFKRGMPYGLFSVFLQDSMTFIGQVDMVPTGTPGEVEIGWIFHKKYHNCGYCSEVITSFLIPFIKNLSTKKVKASGQVINRIIATTHPQNLASKRIMMKANLAYYRKGFRYGGNPRNWYALNLGGCNEQ